jgi:DNA-binding transcriptional LysR family regulator
LNFLTRSVTIPQVSSDLDPDLLRTFVAIQESGGFVRAARLLGLTPSAVSLQMSRLEERAGQPLFRKQGRSLLRTEQGELLLGYARRLLQLNQEALVALGRPDLPGRVRVGAPQDVAERVLPEVLGQFARTQRRTRVEARIDSSAALLAALARGELDLAVTVSPEGAGQAVRLAEAPLRWIGGPRPCARAGEPVPLVLFDAPCAFRSAALAALDRAGLPFRIAFTSPSLSGLWAAVEAGLGLTVRTPLGLPRRLQLLGRSASGLWLPPLPPVSLWLSVAAGQPAGPVELLRDLLRTALPQRLARDLRGRRAARRAR